jgi:hypothetical protein
LRFVLNPKVCRLMPEISTSRRANSMPARSKVRQQDK